VYVTACDLKNSFIFDILTIKLKLQAMLALRFTVSVNTQLKRAIFLSYAYYTGFKQQKWPPIVLIRHYASIVYRFWVIASYLSKVANFNPPHLHLFSTLGMTLSEFRWERQENTVLAAWRCASYGPISFSLSVHLVSQYCIEIIIIIIIIDTFKVA